ncbi:MAG: IS66 family insertion sequence element accessory protein TnpB [Oligoflexus sp.]
MAKLSFTSYRGLVMHSPNEFAYIYLYKKAFDMRRSINSLAAIVQQEMLLDPFRRSLFVFCNKRRTHLKILYWQRTGFCLWMMRLEKHKFAWPSSLGEKFPIISAADLMSLINGQDIVKMKPHETLNYQAV